MNDPTISFLGETLRPLASGGLFWAAARVLVVSDLHLGKSERIARRGGALLPPYETDETLARLELDIRATAPETVICLGDSFDDGPAAQALSANHRAGIARLQQGRAWHWVQGNHDPDPHGLGGESCPELRVGALVFRHIALPEADAGEVSGHFHPKARLRGMSRPCFLQDHRRLWLPAYGHYTGGLDWTAPELRRLFDPRATAYLTGRQVLAVPMPRVA